MEILTKIMFNCLRLDKLGGFFSRLTNSLIINTL